MQRVFANLKADLFVTQVGFDPKPLIFKEIGYLVKVGILALCDPHQNYLGRREPTRQPPRVVLDENAEEALERTEDRPVQHHGRLFLAVLVDEMRTEPSRQVEIDL